ncbi:MAG TPA: tetratricopeptide repeat protein [Planctomycetota bacterium]|nr:tetratricopeptide repeat protein [Planctomycetota bacterium]
MKQARQYSRILPFLAAGALLLGLPGCLDDARQQISQSLPFMPQSKYVMVGGRRLTRAEVAYYQKIKDLSYATKVNPRDAVAYNAIGELFQKKGNYSLAKDLYYKALDIDDTLSEAHHSLGRICIYESRWTEAADHLNKAKKLSPDDARIRHRSGQVKIGMGRIDEALREFDEAIALDNEYTPAYLEKAKVLYELRRYAEAAGLCRTALNNIPKADPTAKAKTSRGKIIDRVMPLTSTDDEPQKTWRQEAAYDLALCLKAQGQIREALAALVQAEDAPAGRLDVQILKSKLLDASGDTQLAITTLMMLRKEFPETAEIPKRLAKLYQKTGQNDLAAKTRLEAAELDHSDRELQEEAARYAEQQKDGSRAIAIYERLVRVDPEDLRYRRALAKAYDGAGINRQAALAYQEIVNRVPDDVTTRRRLGMLFADLPGFQGRAILHFQRVLERNPRDAEVNRRLGELFLQAGNLAEAERFIKQTLVYAPRDAEAHMNLGSLYGTQQRFEDAIQKYKDALAIDPKLNKAQLNMAKVLLGLGRREEAIAPLRAHLAAEPLDEKAMNMLASTLRDLGRREEAIKEYEAINALKSGDLDSNMQLATLQKDLGQQRAAVGIYESILEKSPANVDALREAGRLYTELDMPLRAIFCWQRLLALKPGDLEGQSRLAAVYKSIGAEDAALAAYESVGKAGDADAWRHLAAMRVKRNEKPLAREALRQILKIKHQDIEARRNLAALLSEIDQPDEREEALKEAIKLYQEILELDATDNRARLNLANLLSECNHLSEAQEQYDTILRDKPDHTGALVGLGVVWRKRSRYEKAVDTYHLALKADPKLKVAHYNMALIYDFYLNDRAKAQIHYERFIELGGDPSKLPENLTPPGTRKKTAGAKPEATAIAKEPAAKR